MACLRRVCVGILAVCFAAFAIAGCGGSSDETKPEALTTAQYVKRANAICTKANERQEALLKKEIGERAATGVASNAEREAFVTNAGLPPLREQAASLDALGAPAGEEKKAEALVDSLERAIKQIEKEPLAFSEGESTAFVPAERLARELKIEACGQP